jgi:hypothetical protein
MTPDDIRLYSYMKLYNTRVAYPRPRHPVTYHKQFNIRDIKTVLLELPTDTIPLLTGNLYEIVLKAQKSLNRWKKKGTTWSR